MPRGPVCDEACLGVKRTTPHCSRLSSVLQRWVTGSLGAAPVMGVKPAWLMTPPVRGWVTPGLLWEGVSLGDERGLEGASPCIC